MCSSTFQVILKKPKTTKNFSYLHKVKIALVSVEYQSDFFLYTDTDFATIIFECFILMNEYLLIVISLRKECLVLTVVDMKDQCSERNLRMSKPNYGKNHVDHI